MSSRHSSHATRPPRRRSPGRRVILILCALALLVSGFFCARHFYQKQMRKNLTNVSTAFVPAATPEPTPEPTPDTEASQEPTPTPEPTPVPVDIPVDLASMQRANSDVDGWIVMPDSEIDNPVLYDNTDSVYYLDHTRTGEYSASGSIFVDGYNNRDFEDFLTVLYGHNMRDRSMFGSLRSFKDQSYFDSHDTIVIYTEDRKLTYQVFAAYTRDNNHILASTWLDTEEERQAYIDSIYTHDGIFNYDVEVTPDDRLIALSTCTGWTYTRFIVEAVLISDEPGVYNG